ncbi:MAG: transcription elongation factor GreA [Patescibacteria group bacterium]
MKIIKRQTQQISKIRFTQEGYEELKKRYAQFLADRPDAVMHLKTAREMGDLSENGYYKASRAKLSFIDGQLMRMKFQLKNAEIVEQVAGTVDIGCTIILEKDGNQTTYRIVGDLEANPSEGTISLLSPIGKAVKHKKVGDTITLHTPKGELLFKLIQVS